MIDNALGHVEAFEQEDVTVVFFPPNCTCWKQPCDKGIITALKKRYKYLYLKDVFDFNQIDDGEKARCREKGRALSRGVVGVAHGNPAHLFDCACYVKRAWQSISALSIKNSFRKAEIMNLTADEDAANAAHEIDDLVAEVIERLTALDLSFEPTGLDDFVHGVGSSEEFAALISF